MELCNVRSLLVAAIVFSNCVTRTASRHHLKHNPMVGCDMIPGSSAREDKCHECGGNGANCQTIGGLLDTMDLRIGYNDILLIPQGAMSIYIAEVRASRNYLAIRAKNNSYYLNGDYNIELPRSIIIAGATWYYERSPDGLPSPDKLRCQGPTNQPLLLSLLLQEANVGVKYEYSVPSALAPPPIVQYNWVHDKFSPCSASCGGGIQTRNVTCRSREETEVVDEQLCEILVKPVVNQSCNTQACPARWVEGPWSLCSKDCGRGGTRSRQVHCEKIIANWYPSIVVDNKECFQLLGPKPPLIEECNQYITCPIWFTGPWKPCDKLCGEGKQSREVVCYQKIKGRVLVLSDDQCLDEKPSAEQPCLVQPCEGVDWVLSNWTGCDNCLSKVRSRTAVCVTVDQKVVNDSFCGYHPTPFLEEPCDRTKLPSCEIQWYATQWSKCSVECGTGVQSRRIFCGLFGGAGVMKVVDDSLCDSSTRYNDTKPCGVPNDKCPAKWFAGPWSESCSVECGTGVQSRHIFCGLFDGFVFVKVDDSSCDSAARYKDTKPCEMPKDKICPSKWFAGSWSKCTQECGSGESYRRVMCLSENAREFSSSSDCDVDSLLDCVQSCNLGPCNADDIKMPVSHDYYDYEDYEDCGEEAGYREASLEEDTSISSVDKMFSDSPFTSESETGSGFAPLDWATAITELVTKKPKCKRRVAKKCTKTKFGCCPDKRTPAAGPFDKGCARPESCSESMFGCCPDGVSQSTGPNDWGCPTVPCAETLFGCCKSDNKTLAEGNDQEGCPLIIELLSTEGSGFSSTDTTFSTEQDWTMESGSTDGTVDSSTETGETRDDETSSTEVDSTVTEVTELSSLWNEQATSSIVTQPTTNKVYRSDYVYNKKTDAFYKMHTETASHEDANSVCVVEGAALMMRSSPFDLFGDHGILKQLPYIGDFVWVANVFEPQTESTTSIFPSERLQCDILHMGEIGTYKCSERLPFICKIDAKKAIYNSECDVYNTGYAKAQNVSSCYKLPRMAFTWDLAHADCQAEGAHLVVLNSQVEHDAVLHLIKESPRIQGTTTWWFFFAGFKAEMSTDGSSRVFKTIFNQTLEEAGYSTWMPNEPNNAMKNENCGAIFLNDGNFNDVECTATHGFICEKEIT